MIIERQCMPYSSAAVLDGASSSRSIRMLARVKMCRTFALEVNLEG